MNSLQGGYTPIVIHQPTGAVPVKNLPDWLRSAYIDLDLRLVSYTEHTVKEYEVGTPDAIAYAEYKDSSWWWLICTVNGIINPIKDMQPGMVLKIPKLHQVQALLNKGSKSRDLRGTIVSI